ncbi:histidine phosphatase family protein [Actinotalea sp.]|uniref:NUDIX hydrolase n=1 Tax=Actinotalea sp. TaxID=1872145 RepID=UPI0035664CC3
MSASTGPAAPSAVHAAGAVPWREREGDLEVALVHRPRYRDWSWPKGKLDPGEPVAAAAAREVAEETGIPIVLGVPLPPLRYSLPDGGTKHVRYWAARVAQEHDSPALAARPPVTPAAVTEIDDVVWVRASTARDMLTRPSDRKPLDALAALWAQGRLDTHVVAVARHGQARPRARWDGSESDRPLTPVGERQARALVPVLAAFGIRQVVTSPWRRCADTAAPYVAASGVPVDRVEALTEDAHAADPEATAGIVLDHLSRARDVLLTTHRPALSTVMATIADSTRRWTGGTLPTSDPYLRTGELLVAHVCGTGPKARVVAIGHHRPVRQPAAL